MADTSTITPNPAMLIRTGRDMTPPESGYLGRLVG
jgi:hypothetical protein